MMSQTPQPPLRRPRKRLATPVYGGQEGSYKSINNDFICPICFDYIDEAYMTKCGHSFCHRCIDASMERNNRCPRCGVPIEGPNHLFPNFTLMELVRKHKQEEQRANSDKQVAGSSTADGGYFVCQDWDMDEVNTAMSLLVERKRRLEQDTQVAQTRMLKTFLEEIHSRKEKEIEKLQQQMNVLTQDCKVMADRLHEQEQKQLACPDHLVPNRSSSSLSSSSLSLLASRNRTESNDFGSSCSSSNNDGGVDNGCATDQTGGGGGGAAEARVVPPVPPPPPATRFATGLDGGQESFAGGARPTPEMSEARKKRKLSQHFEDLQTVYLDMRTGSGIGGESCSNLDQFATCLSKFSQYTCLRAVASLNYTHEVFTNSSSIVSSIEFDRDCEFFAIAGVTKKIKVFEYGMVRDAMVDLHYPVTEMTCASKISCLAWNPYRKHMLSSADYSGNVYMWDTSTNQRTQLYTEHEKRCWSVDFNRMDPKLLASGSDDTKVKLWDWDRSESVMTIEGGANVCCVKFNPNTRYNLAFGSADHCVHYYDLRNPKKAVSVFRGHGKAVSYVKFLNGSDMVSASTDSQLKLWSMGHQNAIRTFKGHINEKNFVGLATDGDYIACGSENNSLYLYYKGLSKHILTYKFEPARRLIEKPLKDDDSTEFVSAVTWKPDSNILVAANSQGLVQLLELV